MKRINVTRSFLPPIEEYERYLKRIWESNQLTNQGPLIKEFESESKIYLGVTNFQFVTNGTVALQFALEALGISDGEVITTPFTYVATTSAILWQRCKPVFVDIDPETLNIDPGKIEEAITPRTKAILAVHVFGNPCDIEAIEATARKHNLKVIYDAAHAFGVKYKGRSVFDYGDVSICSFHATKLFHTIEGGAVISKNEEFNNKLDLVKRFGHFGDEHVQLGINGKSSEFNAAMGLVNLNHIDSILADRRRAHEAYDRYLKGKFKKQKIAESTDYNYSYYPIIFKDEKSLLKAKQRLEENNIFPRRYFYPSLNTLPYLPTAQKCPLSESISRRILCLPLYAGVEEEVIRKVCEVIS